MKEHFKKYCFVYQIILIILCFTLAGCLIYFGSKNRNKNSYTEEEAVGIMKLQADKLTRMIEIQSQEGSCETTSRTTLTPTEMNTYGFDSDFYKSVTYQLKCENEVQQVVISIIGTGDFKNYRIKDYISNQT